MVVTISLIVVIIVVGVGILAFRFRTEKGIESGITSFRRELHALAPRPGDRDASPGPTRPPDDPRGVTIMSNDSSTDASADEDDPPVEDAVVPEADSAPAADPVAEDDPETDGDGDAPVGEDDATDATLERRSDD